MPNEHHITARRQLPVVESLYTAGEGYTIDIASTAGVVQLLEHALSIAGLSHLLTVEQSAPLIRQADPQLELLLMEEEIIELETKYKADRDKLAALQEKHNRLSNAVRVLTEEGYSV